VDKKAFFTIALTLVLLFSAVSGLQLVRTVRAETLIVPDDYSTIQGAVNAANGGDTIFVRNGTYSEAVIVDKTVSIVGENKEATVVDGLQASMVINVVADYVNITGFKIINGGENGINLANSRGATITGNNIVNSNFGINLEHSNQNTISNNILSDNFEGIMLKYSSGNVFINNVLEDGVEGFWMLECNNNYFDNNKVRGTTGFSALHIDNCSNNVFRRNEVSFSQVWGMYLSFYSMENIFSENTFSNNQRDIAIHYCAYNTLYHNNFYISEIDTQDCVNTWDDGKQGNYWSDYNGTDADSDRIGDTPYTVNTTWPLGEYWDYGPDQDFYPLMTPYEIVSPPDPETLIISPENKTYTTNSVALTLSVGELTSGTTYKLDGKLGIATGNTTLNWLSNGTHILTTYAANLNGRLAPTDTVYFTVDSTENETKPPPERVYDYDFMPAIPTPSPIVEILSPTQDENYNTTSIALNFTVTEPEEYSEFNTAITRVRYVLDPISQQLTENFIVYTNWVEVPVASGPEKTKLYSIPFSVLSNGSHIVIVSVTATCTEIPGWEMIASGGDRVDFTVNEIANPPSTNDLSSESPSTTPQPSLTPTPSPEPSTAPTLSPTPSPPSDTAPPEFPSWLVLPPFITATLVAGLAYRRKRHQ
jgi:nitrous oxidase accessory protein